jgi:D-aminoacyl-tRNA deacylase
MRIVLQRVSHASVCVNGQSVAEIAQGILLLIGFTEADNEEMYTQAAEKLVELRIFEDDDGKMNRSLREIEGKILAVPQFTLYGNTKKGRRPSFSTAASPQRAAPMFDSFISALRETGVPVEMGVFGAHMKVNLTNDGPVTLIIDLAPSRVDG